MHIESYGKVWNFDDATVNSQFIGATVDIEEKIDGSQFSCAVLGGNLVMRSKGVEVFAGECGMFSKAANVAEAMKERLCPGAVYRFEYLAKPKHNTIAYSIVPKNYLVLLDIEAPGYSYCDQEFLDAAAEQLEVSRTPTLYSGPMPSREQIVKLLDTESVLGGANIEGVVIKARDRRHIHDGKMLKAKIVSNEFKERHRKDWVDRDPSDKSAVMKIAESLRTEARFAKAVQAAREAGLVEGSVRDIGPMMKFLGQDLHDEHAQYVKDALFKAFWGDIARKANYGFPEWYKRQLAASVEETK